MWLSRPTEDLGKADVTGEETGTRTLSATAVGVQGSEERFAAITLGRSWMQQGLTATCKDCGSELRQSEAEDPASAHELVGAMRTG
jgi:hypothetical protein